jgi:transcriptional regulator with XRE-family HTH domain
MTTPGVGTRGRTSHRLGPKTAPIIRELVAERHRQRLTGSQLIERMGFAWSVDTLYAAERGSCAPTAEFLLVWAEALGRPLTLADRAEAGT